MFESGAHRPFSHGHVRKVSALPVGVSPYYVADRFVVAECSQRDIFLTKIYRNLGSLSGDVSQRLVGGLAPEGLPSFGQMK